MSNIEIIIVDDGSNDGSVDFIKKQATIDKRIKPLYLESNKGTFMCRKFGVLASTAKYILFLDADDYLAQHACERLYGVALEGFDIVQFGVSIVDTINKNDPTLNKLNKHFNSTPTKTYVGDEIRRSIFKKREIPWNLCGKLILSDICKAGYNELEDGYFIRSEDMLGMIAIMRHARNLTAIPDRLYYYNYGIGNSVTDDPSRIKNFILNTGASNLARKHYADKYCLDIDYDKISNSICSDTINRWIASIPDNEKGKYLDAIVSQFGLDRVLTVMIYDYHHQISKIANEIAKCRSESNNTVKTIGIYCPTLSFGGIETVVRSLYQLFSEQNYHMVIFVEKKAEKELNLPPSIKKIFIYPRGSQAAAAVNHYHSFKNALENNPIDLLIDSDTYQPWILWDILLCHQLRIPVILNHHGNFAFPFMKRFGVDYNDRDAVFRCADAVTCLSVATELFFRQNGINAWYIHNPVPNLNHASPMNLKKSNCCNRTHGGA